MAYRHTLPGMESRRSNRVRILNEAEPRGTCTITMKGSRFGVIACATFVKQHETEAQRQLVYVQPLMFPKVRTKGQTIPLDLAYRIAFRNAYRLLFCDHLGVDAWRDWSLLAWRPVERLVGSEIRAFNMAHL